MKCAHKDCDQDGTAQPVLLIRTTRKGFASMAQLNGVAICAEHAPKLKVEDVLTDRMWDEIYKRHREHSTMREGFMPPVRCYTGLEWAHVPEAEAAQDSEG